MQTYKSTSSFNNVYVILMFINCFFFYSQGSKEFLKLKCLNQMPLTMKDIENQDILYIIYYKSDKKGFEQNIINVNNYEIDSYYFCNFFHYPLYLYDYNKFEKKNIRKPKPMFKNSRFICKNIKKTIDISFIKKFGYDIYQLCNNKKIDIYIIDFDIKFKNKFKITQVNRPTFVID